ncbi:anti-sigma factor family protein [Actinorugispora endophytica]|uniref:Putative zinc finger protein n=1 Tax=Actinorugispora endophytica TaxID=1605990 RepID=A0A4R6UVU3_9ACTN|nr:zf-HC2 domain-containing protein [Actinorugispora endophytica]TDQ49585.1 putative zinc finger protein [Actinorugispora endophytica]
MTAWHLTRQQLDDYADGRLDHAMAMSAEAHILDCPRCRAGVPADPAWIRAGWAELRDVVDRPRASLLERLLTRIGVHEAAARLLVATPMLYRAWLLAMVVVLGMALATAYNVNGGTLMFFSLAPVLPLVGVALAYGRWVDPAHEFTSVTPMAGQRLLFLRSLAVLVPAFALCLVTALLLPGHGPGWAPVAWLLPALSLVTGSLLLSRWVPLIMATGLTGTVWTGALVSTVLHHESRFAAAYLFTPPAQALYAVLLAALGTACIAARARRA